ncbi:MAG: response regulator transcription factor [Okeania sp. SIO2C9]|uniref:response regulator n=1 Tax=Okeania sp. SIO2C9 TaxID=2607791 RepID=UPI0013BF8AAD|nr:response regulator transcription factor [Okeania sp. SIO2C9]NEQ76531.1 response regulator transcription factor [Okeania sp. SIO2C9]
MRILIVDDDPMMQLGLEQVLGDYSNIEIVGLADNGKLGVAKAIEKKPDLVVMDIAMPELDGIAATQQIKEKLPDTRVVVLTSHDSQQEVMGALSSGADAYCVKGASIERLISAITAAIDGATYLDPQVGRMVIQNLQPTSPAVPENSANLSSRELDVLKLLVEGKTNTEIAKDLFLSPNTIKTHVKGIMNKLAVDDRVKAAVVALRTGLV